jgi:hypothetical protein
MDKLIKNSPNKKFIIDTSYNNEEVIIKENYSNISIENNEKIRKIKNINNNHKTKCKNLNNLIECSFIKLFSLKILNCKKLKTINLDSIYNLYINNCKNLENINNAYNLNSIKIYNISKLILPNFNNLIGLELGSTKIKINLKYFPKLEFIYIKKCENIIFDIEDLKNLKEFSLSFNNDLKVLSNQNIKLLNVRNCNNLQKIITNINTINKVSYCKSITYISEGINYIKKCYWLELSKIKLNRIIKIQRMFRNKKKTILFILKCKELKTNIFEPKIYKIIKSYF